MAGDLYNLRLSTKGLIFNSAVKTRLKILASGDTAMLHKYETERSLRNLLAKVYGMSAAERAKKNIDEQQLEEQANALEKELHEQSAKYQIKGLQESVRPTWQKMKSKLKKKEAAVEIVQVITKKDTLYVALILKGAIDDLPEMVRLESGGKLEKKSIHYYRNCIQNQVEDVQSYNAFWKPLSPKLKGMRKIYFSADGVYHQINLLTLKNPSTGKYLGDEENIQLVGSIRELIDERKASKAIKAELFGYPDYRGDGKVNNADSNDRGAGSSSLTNELTDGFSRYFNLESGVPSLPGTEKEVNIIDQQFKEHHVPEELFTGVLASEKQIKAVKDPRILHIATHGFFLPNASANSNSGSSDTDLSLLYRSGILLAGCERSMKGYSVAVGEEDGILTAYEAMNLFLDETDLVVLSACETGLGIEQNGEGVQGLQRAFLEAGARTVLTSLWKVDDTATQLLMTTFYKEYLSSRDERQSFQKAQKVVRSKYPHPYYWGAFVMMGK
jgi:CHAT domain-containing protein